MNLRDYNRAGVTCVTIGVTGGQRGFASDSRSSRSTTGARPMAAVAKLIDGAKVHEGFRGKFVEIIFSPVSRKTAKPLKKVVGTTGIEPVTPTMSR